MKKLRDKTAEALTVAGISFHRGDAVENQYFQGQDEYDAERFQNIVDPTPIDENEIWSKAFFQSKPADGGLWTSPGRLEADGGVKTEWTDWAHSEQFMVSNHPLIPLVVKKQAIVAEINSQEDLDALCKAFPRPGGGFSYESLASAGVDAVRLTEGGMRAAKSADLEDTLHNFSNWDIDSTVWLSTDSISAAKPVKKAHYESIERDDNYSSYDDDDDENTWDFLNKLIAESDWANSEEAAS
jgi:hypothetical protein